VTRDREPGTGLERFTGAQARIWPAPLDEIRAGRKQTHWMWFVFPQLRGLGRSAMAERYGIADIIEARAYLGHPVLGPRLTDMCRAMLDHAGTAPETVLGPVDARKLRSCATLFETAGQGAECRRIIESFYAGAPCPATLERLNP